MKDGSMSKAALKTVCTGLGGASKNEAVSRVKCDVVFLLILQMKTSCPADGRV